MSVDTLGPYNPLRLDEEARCYVYVFSFTLSFIVFVTT